MCLMLREAWLQSSSRRSIGVKTLEGGSTNKVKPRGTMPRKSGPMSRMEMERKHSGSSDLISQTSTGANSARSLGQPLIKNNIILICSYFRVLSASGSRLDDKDSVESLKEKNQQMSELLGKIEEIANVAKTEDKVKKDETALIRKTPLPAVRPMPAMQTNNRKHRGKIRQMVGSVV